jgi:hypothetical protein
MAQVLFLSQLLPLTSRLVSIFASTTVAPVKASGGFIAAVERERKRERQSAERDQQQQQQQQQQRERRENVG